MLRGEFTVKIQMLPSALFLILAIASAGFGQTSMITAFVVVPMAPNAQMGLAGEVDLVPVITGTIPPGESITFTYAAPISAVADIGVYVMGCNSGNPITSADFGTPKSCGAGNVSVGLNLVTSSFALAFSGAPLVTIPSTQFIRVTGVRLNMAALSPAIGQVVSQTTTCSTGVGTIVANTTPVAVATEPLVVTPGGAIVFHQDGAAATATTTIRIDEAFAYAFATNAGFPTQLIMHVDGIPTGLKLDPGQSIVLGPSTGVTASLDASTNIAAGTIVININGQNPAVLDHIDVTLPFTSTQLNIPLSPPTGTIAVSLGPPASGLVPYSYPLRYAYRAVTVSQTYTIQAVSSITLTTNPAGLHFTADGTTYTAPQTFSWAVGSSHTIAVSTPQAQGGARQVFTGWSDSGAASHSITTPGSATSYTASFKTQYQLTAIASPGTAGGITVTPSSLDGFYDSGTTVQLSAIANSGYIFWGWSGDVSGSINPVSVGIIAARSVTANFSAATGITIMTDPAGRNFTVDGVAYSSTQIFTWVAGSVHGISTATRQVDGDTRYVFGGWSDGGAESHIITAPSSATTYTAAFGTQYRLGTSQSPAAGGTITMNPAAADGFYDVGTPVRVLATASPGHSFSGWSGDLTGTANPQELIMSKPRAVVAEFATLGSHSLDLTSGGAVTQKVNGAGDDLKVGYVSLSVNSGTTPYGTAVFSYKKDGITVSEVGVPASPPTTNARVFIDYRTGVPPVPAHSESGTVDINTGIALVNQGTAAAVVTYTLRDAAGATLTTGHGTIDPGRHLACFVDQLKDKGVPDFGLPANFRTSIQFGSLDITSTEPLSVLAVRGTMNQRNEFLITTTSVADLTGNPENGPVYFPQLADGGGYTTSLLLINTTGGIERGTLRIWDNKGQPLVVSQAGGASDSSFAYAIPANGVFRFQTDGSPAATKVGWVQLTPNFMNAAPVSSGVFGYNTEGILVSESGVPVASATTHARVYVDLSDNHNTGLALVNVSGGTATVAISAYGEDGTTPVGTGKPLEPLPANGHIAAFADEFVAGLPAGFTGILDVSSTAQFVALTVRSLKNERSDPLMTTFPVADVNRPAPEPVVFPQIASGGGYTTEIILLSAGAPANASIGFYDESGTPADFGE